MATLKIEGARFILTMDSTRRMITDGRNSCFNKDATWVNGAMGMLMNTNPGPAAGAWPPTI